MRTKLDLRPKDKDHQSAFYGIRIYPETPEEMGQLSTITELFALKEIEAIHGLAIPWHCLIKLEHKK